VLGPCQDFEGRESQGDSHVEYPTREIMKHPFERNAVTACGRVERILRLVLVRTG
jgi:hypothetical protein